MEPKVPHSKRVANNDTTTPMILQTYGIQNFAELSRSTHQDQKTSVLIDRLNKTFLAIERRNEQESNQMLKHEFQHKGARATQAKSLGRPHPRLSRDMPGAAVPELMARPNYGARHHQEMTSLEHESDIRKLPSVHRHETPTKGQPNRQKASMQTQMVQYQSATAYSDIKASNLTSAETTRRRKEQE